MKNIQILPTSQPSNLLLCIKSYIEHKDTPAENSDNKGNFTLGFGIYANTEFYQHQHIYITSAEEIKVGDWYYLPRTNSVHKCIEDPTELNLERRLGVAKIIITTDQDLIKDGVQVINDDFLEWFVKNPTCENVEVNKMSYGYLSGFAHAGYKIIIPKEEIQPQQIWNEEKMEGVKKLIQEQETLEEVTEKEASLFYEKGSLDWNKYRQVFIEGAKWQRERMYNEEEVFNLLMELSSRDRNSSSGTPHSIAKWFEQFKKK
jgi:hypothetical protein